LLTAIEERAGRRAVVALLTGIEPISVAVLIDPAGRDRASIDAAVRTRKTSVEEASVQEASVQETGVEARAHIGSSAVLREPSVREASIEACARIPQNRDIRAEPRIVERFRARAASSEDDRSEEQTGGSSGHAPDTSGEEVRA